MGKNLQSEMPALQQTAVQSGQVQPAITWLNLSGDTTITWDESDRQQVMDMIRQKMREGYVFLIVQPVPLLPIIKRRKRIYSVAELAYVNSVIQQPPSSAIVPKTTQELVDSLNDDELADLIRKGQARLARRSALPDQTAVRRAQTPEEVVSNQTVAIRPIAGG